MSENTEPTESASNSEDNREQRQWGMFAHLSAFAGIIIPFGNLIGPLIVWQMKKDDDFISDQGKESLNFQITATLAMIVSGILTLVLIGLLMMLVIGIAWLVLVIIAAIRANDGEAYRYPFTLRLIN
ncbi:MAG: DUF4870 domain-containing protein [Pseudomonadota bacterium]